MEASERNGSENNGSRRIDNGDGSKGTASGKEMSHNKDDEKLLRCISYRYCDREAIERSESKNDRGNLVDDKYDRDALVKESNNFKADEKLPTVSKLKPMSKEKEIDSKGGDRGIAAEEKCQLKYDKVPIITPTKSSHADDKALPTDVPIVDVKEKVAAEFDGTAVSKIDDEHNLIKKGNGTIIDYNSNDSNSDKGFIPVEKNQVQDDVIPIATSTRSSYTNPVDVPLYIVDIEGNEAAEFDICSTGSREGDIHNSTNNRSEATTVYEEDTISELSKKRNSIGTIKSLFQIIDNDGTVMFDSEKTESAEQVDNFLKDSNRAIVIPDTKVDTTTHNENGSCIQASQENDQNVDDGYVREYVISDINEQNPADNNTVESSRVNIDSHAPWLPPSILHAVEFKQRSIFREGISPLWETNITKASDLSRGVLLYFEFAKSASICMLLLSILSIPSIIFSYFGERIPISNRDAIGFSQFTIGNIGYDRSSLTYSSDSTCKNQPSSYTGRCITFFGSEMKFADAETVLSTFEFLQIVVYLLFILRLFWKSASFSRREGDLSLYKKNHLFCHCVDYLNMYLDA
jgi:hypothetical protein